MFFSKPMQKKLLLLVAMTLLLLGLSLLASGCSAIDAGKLVTKNYTISESFSGISAGCSECSIRILPSEDNSVTVVCKEREKNPHSVSVKNNILTIAESKKHVILSSSVLSSDHAELTIYLPADFAQPCSLDLETASGDIELDQCFFFSEGILESASGSITVLSSFDGDLTIDTASGDISLFGCGGEALDASTASGSISLDAIGFNDKVSLETASGKIKLTNMSCVELDMETASGSIYAESLMVDKELSAETASGKIELQYCDAAKYDLETASGNIKGLLLSPMSFDAESDSGRVSVPNTDGGQCKIRSSSGNIDFEIVQ